MFITTKGIVLRTYPFRDNKLISKIFTEHDGFISCIISKKSQRILSEPLTIVEIIYKKPKRSSSLIYIKDCHADYIYKNLTTNSKKIHCSIILCEILNKCVNEKNHFLYNFIIDGFKYLDACNSIPVAFNSFFLIKFCEIMGIKPLGGEMIDSQKMILDMSEGCYVSKKMIKNKSLFVPFPESLEIYKLSFLNFSNLEDYNITRQCNSCLFNYLISYISIHLTDLTKLKSIKILKELT